MSRLFDFAFSIDAADGIRFDWVGIHIWVASPIMWVALNLVAALLVRKYILQRRAQARRESRKAEQASREYIDLDWTQPQTKVKPLTF